MQSKKGVKVISNDSQKIGILELVITDSKDDCVTHLVISSGLWIKKRKRLSDRISSRKLIIQPSTQPYA
jgi:hypothetical protein